MAYCWLYYTIFDGSLVDGGAFASEADAIKETIRLGKTEGFRFHSIRNLAGNTLVSKWHLEYRVRDYQNAEMRAKREKAAAASKKAEKKAISKAIFVSSFAQGFVSTPGSGQTRKIGGHHDNTGHK